MFGGSTDNPYFIEKFGYGSVISFSCDLKTYITIHEDKLGYNIDAGKYIINYSRREETNSIKDIRNDPVRVVLEHFKPSPLTVSMTSDAYSQGSGLASSSAYINSMIKCLTLFNRKKLTDVEICRLSYTLESKINPFCGLQDPYGCGIGGFKRIEFDKDKSVKFNFLNTDLFDHFEPHLVFTGITRNSLDVLKDVTNNIEKAKPILDTLYLAYDHLLLQNYDDFLQLINQTWTQKKQTCSSIMANERLRSIDQQLNENSTVISHKLCGAGNGGFFLVFSHPGKLSIPLQSVKISVETNGVIGSTL
ncbi:hypothetical protein [Prochlorococcus sp. MIT 1341]|uniref:GHMP family kinase ATP-binding protein n=1 Tax=Prochlorococcus sp. MIT 1341 TaxID=3096221 RepID=UPI002A7501B4|nr:hypothetical protein [Prochlorococcus sp. MIT 1341]